MDRLESLVNRLEIVTAHLEKTQNIVDSNSVQQAPHDTSTALSAFEQLIASHLDPFIKLPVNQSGTVKELVDLLNQCFQDQLKFLQFASNNAKPDQSGLSNKVQPLLNIYQSADAFASKKGADKNTDQLKALSESCGVYAWVIVDEPVAYIQCVLKESVPYYTNRLLMQDKEKNSPWVTSLLRVLSELLQFVKKYFEKGLVWNKGQASNGRSGGPPPIPSKPSCLKTESAPAANWMADLQKGGAITSGLRKVTDDMKTHKNPALRATGDDDQPKSSQPSPKPAAAATATKAAPQPVTKLVNKRWLVEHHKNKKGSDKVQITDAKLDQSVYFFDCSNCDLVVSNKVNQITLDKCTKCSIQFDSLVAAFDVINSNKIYAEIAGSLQSTNIDTTDDCSLYLNEKSLSVKINTSKSSGVNVYIPKGDGDYAEHAIPHQFETTYDGRCLADRMLTNSEQDAECIKELEMKINETDNEVDSYLDALKTALEKASGLTVDCMKVFSESVSRTCTTVDASIKLNYALMAKCEELSNSLQDLGHLQSAISSVKDTLTSLENNAAFTNNS